MQVDSNGVMQFGVRKRHNIRGTRYSLPQPKGGREAKNPILREDQLIKTGASRKAKVRSSMTPARVTAHPNGHGATLRDRDHV